MDALRLHSPRAISQVLSVALLVVAVSYMVSTPVMLAGDLRIRCLRHKLLPSVEENSIIAIRVCCNCGSFHSRVVLPSRPQSVDGPMRVYPKEGQGFPGRRGLEGALSTKGA